MEVSINTLSTAVIMVDKSKAIIFYRCNSFYFYVESIDERPAMGSQPNLASRSEVMSIYKCPTKLLGAPPQIWGAKNAFLPRIFDKQKSSVNLQCVP